MCDSLTKIRDECIEKNLKECYEDHDYQAHLGYLLESLKVSTNVLALHLSNVTNIPSCSAFQMDISMNEAPKLAVTPQKSSNSLVVVLAASFVTMLFCFSIFSVLIVGHRTRLWPRMSAWIRQTPYSDFDRKNDPEANNQAAMERRSSENEEDNETNSS